MEEHSPGDIIGTLRWERVPVLVAVPRLFRSLGNQLKLSFDLSGGEVRKSGVLGIAGRWWCYRHVHRGLGWKFWPLRRVEPVWIRERRPFWENPAWRFFRDTA